MKGVFLPQDIMVTTTSLNSCGFLKHPSLHLLTVDDILTELFEQNVMSDRFFD